MTPRHPAPEACSRSARWRALPALLSLALASAIAADNPSLRHDPFARPVEPAAAAGQPDASPPAPWQPTLRGVLLAGKGSLANVDGTLVAIGEKIEGHRLLSVSDRQAVFEKDGRRIVLDMRRALEPKP